MTLILKVMVLLRAIIFSRLDFEGPIATAYYQETIRY